MRALPVILLLLLLAGCGEPSTTRPLQTHRAELGEPVGDTPSYQERLLLYLTNRARTAPADFNPDDPYPPSAPLAFDFDLADAARFHATHIIEANCWCEDHSSCCPLSDTDGAVACDGPTTGCGAMGAGERVALFSSSYAGENMARGQVDAHEAMTSWTFSPGHWSNINNPGATQLGTGNFQSAWVQDFGGGASARSVIMDGVHFADGASTRFGTTYHQAGSGGPRTALVIVEGECHELDVVHGEPELGAFETALTLGPGCHRYYFHFTDGNGNDATYPSFGSFGVGVGTSDCEFFIDTRPADTCSPSGQTCMTGDTRHCYTGPFGTEGVGICEAGAERCIAGQWDGECRLEIGPSDEVCDNAADDDCDGEVDEDCGSTEDVGAVDAGNSDDVSESSPPPAKIDDDDGGCSTASSGPVGPGLIVLIAVAVRRRRRD